MSISQQIITAPRISRDFTATTFIVQNDSTLLLLHRKLGKWFPPGGHIEPNELPHEAALREVHEESGLEVTLFNAPSRLGTVLILPQPICILLEDISPDHQHIDLIYFAYVTGGELLPSAREAKAARWLNSEQLNDPEIAEDIRVLGQQAIMAYRNLSLMNV